MSSHVIGTAGHIDHGKSTLVKALTGIDPDRLKEEKEREMTIDLGFAYIYLPSGKKVGIVDVPGHERFVRNMLSGATGIDLVLLVIAADEGVMPQTREHLDILNLLSVKKGIIVVTKMDMVDDEWLELVIQEIRKKVEGTFLSDAPVMPVSSRTGEGLPELVEKIDELLITIPPRDLTAPARFPVDRVFSIAGFGTVVTGTLWEGQVKLGETLELMPQGKHVRIRSIQHHNESAAQGDAGNRLALNISAVSKEELARGNVLAEPGFYKPTRLIDIWLELSKDAPIVKYGDRVHFFLGTGETVGRLRLLDRDELKPGESAFAEIRLNDPVVARRKDHFVIRRYSPVITIGGGEIVEPYAVKKKRNDREVMEELKILKDGGEREILLAVLDRMGRDGAQLPDLKVELALVEGLVLDLITKLEKEDTAVKIENNYFSRRALEGLRHKLIKEINHYFRINPQSSGIVKEELREKAKVRDKKIFNSILAGIVAEGEFVLDGDWVKLKGREATFSKREENSKHKLENSLLKNAFSPPGPKEIVIDETDKKVYKLLLQEGVIIKVSEEIIYHEKTLEEIKRLVSDHIGSHGKITAAELRDLMQVSRKYAVPLLEYFDRVKFTKRVGDERVLY